MHTIRKKYFFTVAVFLFITYHLVPLTLAATMPMLRIDPHSASVEVGKPFTMRILLDSDVPLNAYSIQFKYSSDYLKIVNVNSANSILDVWRNQPVISNDGIIKIEGGSIHPWSGTSGEILEIHFMPQKSGEASVGFKSAALYAADGKGTLVPASAEQASFTVGKYSADGSVPVTSTDEESPKITSASFVKDPYDSGDKILSFSVQDQGSGVNAVELRTKTGFSWSDWQRVVNPAGIGKSVWAAELKVTDNAGNISNMTLYDMQSLGNLVFYAVLVIASLLTILSIMRKRNKFFRKRR